MPPLPKKKMSTRRKGKRRFQIQKDAKKSLILNLVSCKHCGSKKEIHTLCKNCGK